MSSMLEAKGSQLDAKVDQFNADQQKNVAERLTEINSA